jgi:hypothetical protein
MQSRADEDLDQTFENLFQVIRSERFLARRGLGNEMPFFISAFHPSLQNPKWMFWCLHLPHA